jgi:hypothetical protein
VQIEFEDQAVHGAGQHRQQELDFGFRLRVPGAVLRAGVEPGAGGRFGGGQLVPPLDHLGEAHGIR